MKVCVGQLLISRSDHLPLEEESDPSSRRKRRPHFKTSKILEKNMVTCPNTRSAVLARTSNFVTYRPMNLAASSGS
jgi:hypothetical protein